MSGKWRVEIGAEDSAGRRLTRPYWLFDCDSLDAALDFASAELLYSADTVLYVVHRIEHYTPTEDYGGTAAESHRLTVRHAVNVSQFDLIGYVSEIPE